MTRSSVWDFSLLFYFFQLETLRNFLGFWPVALFAPAELQPREHRGYPQSRGFGGTNANTSLSALQREKGITARQTNPALSLLCFLQGCSRWDILVMAFLAPTESGERVLISCVGLGTLWLMVTEVKGLRCWWGGGANQNCEDRFKKLWGLREKRLGKW